MSGAAVQDDSRYSCEDASLTATGARATSQGTLEVKSQRIDVHGEKITATTRFKLIPVRVRS